MGSNALKATILDRGHSKELSRGVESHFAAQGTGGSSRTAPGEDSWEGLLGRIPGKYSREVLPGKIPGKATREDLKP